MGDFAADGTITHATDLNKVLKIAATAGSMVGSPPAVGASSGFLIAVGTVVTTTNAAGGWSISFPTAFPNSLIAAFVIAGDNNAANVTHTLIGAQQLKTSIGGIAYAAGAAMNTQTIRINYLAFGS